jgi:hypothetical protein
MNDKFTLRDFFAFFLSGIAVFIFAFINFYEPLTDLIWQNKEILKDYSTIIIFFSIPFAYFVGQILHGIDSIIFFIAASSRKWKVEKKEFSNILWIVIYLQNGYRISGKLFIQNKDSEEFWEDCARIQVKNLFSNCEYWYVMNDLFKGLSLASFIFFTISIFTKTWLLALLYFLLTIIFWFRAVYFAGNFIQSVQRTVKFVK